MNLRLLSLTAVSALALLASNQAEAREQIRAVGSSTVYPFVTSVAETFAQNTGNKTPVVESTGTGGGFKLFCAGAGDSNPDIANASRPIKDSELELCRSNGVTEIEELKIGYDGIVLANSVKGPKLALTRADIFKALARKVPVDGKLVENPFKTWKDVNASLPATAITVYGPPPTSGTRDAFAEMVLDKACVDLPEFVAAIPDKSQRGKECMLIREDGAYVEAGENDNLIIQKLVADDKALGIFGYSFLEQNLATVQAASVEGVAPNAANITNASYPVSRPLYVYVKKSQLAAVPGLPEFVEELMSDSAIGKDGYLVSKGLIPLTPEQKASARKEIK